PKRSIAPCASPEGIMSTTLRRLWNLLRRDRIDEELRQEIETHLALIEEDEQARGSSPDRARIDARARFGNPLSYREGAVDAAVATWLEAIAKEIMFAARRLLRSSRRCRRHLAPRHAGLPTRTRAGGIPVPFRVSECVGALEPRPHPLYIPVGFGVTSGPCCQNAERMRALASLAIYAGDDAT